MNYPVLWGLHHFYTIYRLLSKRMQGPALRIILPAKRHPLAFQFQFLQPLPVSRTARAVHPDISGILLARSPQIVGTKFHRQNIYNQCRFSI